MRPLSSELRMMPDKYKLWSQGQQAGSLIHRSSPNGTRLRLIGLFNLRRTFVKAALALSLFLGTLSSFAPPSLAVNRASQYDASAPAMQMPGAGRYLKKHMWKPDKFDMFESVYLKADQPASTSGGGGGSSLIAPPLGAKLISDALPIVAVGGLVVGGGYGAVKLDGYMKGVKEKWREEEIELYGEELTVDATPVEVEDVEFPDDGEESDDGDE